MTEKPGKGIIADEDIDIQTKSLTILSAFQADNHRDNSKRNIMISCLSNIFNTFSFFNTD